MKTAVKDLIQKLEKLRLIKEDENSYELFRQLEIEALEKEKEQEDIEYLYNLIYNQNK